MDVLDDLHVALDGRYEVVRELGRGGMAVVYLAHDLKHDRDVAIKVLPPEVMAGVGVERFLHEIRTAAQLSHPNILPLHDSIAAGRVRCYVMPFVQGDSLRQRLERERQLDVDQAVDIVRQVAAGLDYAHAHGIIHRDIKPENILLVGDQAVIADFGLARAIFASSSAPLTASGVALGTPAYMSPEQAAADRKIDGRSDVYSVACLFFEMVAGLPPFRGATAAAVIAAHATRTPPSLCAERPTCPGRIDGVVQRAMAKAPADRYRTAGEFAHALQEARTGGAMVAIAPPRARPPVRWLVAAGAAVALLATSMFAVPRMVDRVALLRTPLDSDRVLVLPFAGAGGRHVTAGVAHDRVTSALMGWRDLRVLELSPAEAPSAPEPARASEIARRRGAARVLLGTVTPLGDSVELRGTLYDARGDPVRQQTVRVPDDATAGAERYRQLAASLLRTSDGEDDAEDANPGTTRVAAWRAFTRGDSARRAWSLEMAEREFRRAVSLDPQFAQAHLWLAQVLAWERPVGRAEWSSEADRAKAAASTLGMRDSLLADGLAALGSAQYPSACRSFRALHSLEPASDVPWYGIAHCLGTDPIVVADATSPSGWRFRGSVSGAAAALDSGLAHTEGVPVFAMRMLGALLIVEPLRLRAGHTETTPTQRFLSMPSLVSDTVALVPYPAGKIELGVQPYFHARSDALRKNLLHLDTEYHRWVKLAPRSVDGWTALSYVQELQGEPEAMASQQRARSLTADPDRLLAIDINRVRLLAKNGRFAAARGVADSLLYLHSALGDSNAAALAGVAALIGDQARATKLLTAAALLDQRVVFESSVPLPVQTVPDAVGYLVAGSLGNCTPDLHEYLPRIERLLARYAPEAQREQLRRVTESRPTSLAVPCLGPAAVVPMPNVDRLVRMQQYLARGQLSELRAAFDTLHRVREGLRPGDIALDHTFQEAWLLLAMHDTGTAIEYLDLPLTSLSTLNTHLLDDVASAAALARALALRAQLAIATGDRQGAMHFTSQLTALRKSGPVVTSPDTGATRSLDPVPAQPTQGRRTFPPGGEREDPDTTLRPARAVRPRANRVRNSARNAQRWPDERITAVGYDLHA